MSIPELELIQLQIILDNAGLIDLKYQETRRSNNFNVFNLIARRYDEVNLHSKFIYELLNPKGTHGCGKIFLRQFLTLLQINDFNDDYVIVQKEHRKIDLLITNYKQAIIIENKLLADDQPKQLENYYNSLSNSGFKIIKIIYLSLDNKDATEQSVGVLKFLPEWESIYHPISYEYHIGRWIENCIKEVYDKPVLRETLIQYKSLINEITDQMENREEMLEMIDFISKGDNVFKAKKIADNWIHVRWHTEWYFWQDLEKAISSEYPILELQKYSRDKLDGVIHGSRNRMPWYGLMFELCEYKEARVCIFIERGKEDVYYGLTMVKKSSERYSDDRQFISIAKKIAEISDWPGTGQWMGGNYCDPPIDFESFSNSITISLVNVENRREYIANLWIKIKEFIQEVNVVLEQDPI